MKQPELHTGDEVEIITKGTVVIVAPDGTFTLMVGDNPWTCIPGRHGDKQTIVVTKKSGIDERKS